MIRLDDTRQVSEHIKSRAANMPARVVNYFNDFEKEIEVEVEPDRPDLGKVAHTVTFRRMRDPGRWEQQDDGTEIYQRGERFIGIFCYEKYPLRPCEANRRRRHCAHVEAAIREVVDHSERITLCQ